MKLPRLFRKEKKHEETTNDVVYNIIVDYKLEHNGNSPSFSQIIELCEGVTSKSTLSNIIGELERDGRIISPTNLSKALIVVGGKFVMEKR